MRFRLFICHTTSLKLSKHVITDTLEEVKNYFLAKLCRMHNLLRFFFSQINLPQKTNEFLVAFSSVKLLVPFAMKRMNQSQCHQ